MAERLTWTVATRDLRPGTPYLGSINWRGRTDDGGDSLLGSTLVSIKP